MKTFMRPILITLNAVVIFMLASCAAEKKKPYSENTVQATSYCVALDLSDRIIEHATVEKDIEAVKIVFQQFKRDVVENGKFIASKSSFRVDVIPQTTNKKIQNELDALCDALSLDMARISMKDKRCEFLEFERQLQTRLEHLYQMAYKKSSAEYSGCDIIGYLNNSFSVYVDSRKTDRIHLFLLTDGYLEIDNEDETYTNRTGVNYTSRKTLNTLREGDKWQDTTCSILLLPEKLAAAEGLSRTQIILVGLNPSSRSKYYYEEQMLEKMWYDMFRRLNVKSRIISYIHNKSVIKDLITNG